MPESQIDLQDRLLSNEEELKIIYEGVSFDGKMEISDLTTQLKSTEFLIREIISEVHKQKGFKEKAEAQIFLKLKSGSFHETISVILNSQIMQTTISGCLIALFTYYLNSKHNPKVKIPKCEINIEKMINNFNTAKNIKQITDPLIDEGDTIQIISSANSGINTRIKFKDKQIFRDKLKELKDQVEIGVFEEEFFGTLSMVNLDKDKYKFALEGNNQLISAEFDIEPELEEIRKILGERLKISARATYEDKVLKSLDIISYDKKRRRNLGDFS